jgi:hypothetical protein
MIRKILAIVIIGVMHVTCSHAQTTMDPSTGNTVFTKMPYDEYLFDLALSADMLQSLQIHQHPNFIETNALLGSHPSEGQIIGYFVGVGTLHWLSTHEMVREHVPSSFIHAWEAGTIGLEMAYVKHNASLGIHFYVP